MIAWLTRSRKAITAEIAILLTWAGTAYVPDGSVSRLELYALIVALAGGLGVYAVPNALTGAQVAAHLASHPEDAPTVPTVAANPTWLSTVARRANAADPPPEGTPIADALLANEALHGKASPR